jgi:hypothetical protein
MHDYLEKKSMIPPGNLLELRFEEFEQEPVKAMEKIYTTLFKEDFSAVKQYFIDYARTQESHKKNRYQLETMEIELIQEHLGKYLELYNYDLPVDLKAR